MIHTFAVILLLLAVTPVRAQTVVLDIQSRCLLGPPPDDTIKLELGKPWPDPLGRPQVVDGGVFFQWKKTRLCAGAFTPNPFDRTIRFDGDVILKDEQGNITRGSNMTLVREGAEAFLEAAKSLAPR